MSSPSHDMHILQRVHIMNNTAYRGIESEKSETAVVVRRLSFALYASAACHACAGWLLNLLTTKYMPPAMIVVVVVVAH